MSADDRRLALLWATGLIFCLCAVLLQSCAAAPRVQAWRSGDCFCKGTRELCAAYCGPGIESMP